MFYYNGPVVYDRTAKSPRFPGVCPETRQTGKRKSAPRYAGMRFGDPQEKLFPAF